MAQQKVRIYWAVSAQKQFQNIIIYLQNESPVGAEIVFNAIISNIDKLASNPEMYPADALRTDKDKTFRAFTVFSYRITYRITKKGIYIYRIRHTSMEPLEH